MFCPSGAIKPRVDWHFFFLWAPPFFCQLLLCNAASIIEEDAYQRAPAPKVGWRQRNKWDDLSGPEAILWKYLVLLRAAYFSEDTFSVRLSQRQLNLECVHSCRASVRCSLRSDNRLELLVFLRVNGGENATNRTSLFLALTLLC